MSGVARAASRSWVAHGALATALLLGPATEAAAGSASGQVGDLDVTARDVLAAPSHGYGSYRVTLSSRSARPETVRLKLPANPYGGSWSGSLESLTRTLVVPPGGTASVLLAHPSVPLLGAGLTVETEDDLAELSLGLSGASRGRLALELLVSPSLRDDDVKPLFDVPAPEGPAPPPAIVSSRPQQAPYRVTRWESLADWEPSWLAYSGFDGVLLTEPELAGLPDAAVGGLRGWVLAGGALAVVSGEGGFVERRLGLSPRAPSPVAVASWDLGLGRVLHARGGPDELVRAGPAAFQDELRRTQSPFPPVQPDPPDAFPEARPASTRGVFLILVLFALLIGPVNLYVCARLGRKTLVLLTVPALSALATVGISLWAFLSEGWDRHLWSETLTLLDEESRTATTFGWSAVYCPVAPNEGLRFSEETELTPLLSGTRARLALDWSGGVQHLAGGWIAPRLPVFFRVRKVETRRERLELSRNGKGELEAVNGLGPVIQRLVVMDAEGVLHSAANVGSGARVSLRPEGERTSEALLRPRPLLGFSWEGLPASVAAAPDRYLSPGSYLAVLERSPFLEAPLDADERRETSVVIGLARSRSREWPVAGELLPVSAGAEAWPATKRRVTR